MAVGALVVSAAWETWDIALRGAGGALLLHHLISLIGGSLPIHRRWPVVAFVLSVMAYLVCSHAEFSVLGWPWFHVLLSLCLVSAPLLWLVVRTMFEDAELPFHYAATALALAIAVGWIAYASRSEPIGANVGTAHKALLIAFAAAILWEVLKSWSSDLVATRRRLRNWVASGLGCYLLIVASAEMLYLGRQPPAGLALLHIAGIALASLILAVVAAKHPLHSWFLELPPDRSMSGSSTVALQEPLTREPATIDRKDLLKQRVIRAMTDQRVYAQEGLTLSELANLLRTTPPQLREAINQGLGYRNFNDFLHHYRIDEASQRLDRQDLPILTIALDVGYGSIGPFNRAFKLIKGATPSEYRSRKAADSPSQR